MPIYKVRFIAVTDTIDSFKDPNSINNVIVPFKNLMNDEYARDISNKVKSVYRTYKMDYEENLNKTKIEISKVENEFKIIGQDNKRNMNWINTFKEINIVEELNYNLVKELIDCIYVHEGGNITIKFKYQDEFEETIKFVKENRDIILAKPVSICC